jgi:hypothetical protein
MTNTVFQRFKLNISLIFHQQALAEHRDLPNTEIFQSKDVASGGKYLNVRTPTKPGVSFRTQSEGSF